MGPGVSQDVQDERGLGSCAIFRTQGPGVSQDIQDIRDLGSCVTFGTIPISNIHMYYNNISLFHLLIIFIGAQQRVVTYLPTYMNYVEL